MREFFRRVAGGVSTASGSWEAFGAAALLIVVWAATGPVFGFSDTWQLVINTTTTIVTFLMVFLIQNAQNRDSQALHAKLNELIVVTRGASNRLAAAEDLTEEELHDLKEHFTEVAQDGAGDAGQVAQRQQPQRSKAKPA